MVGSPILILFCRLNKTSETVVMVIPAIDTISVVSFGISNQLKMAPKTGIMNFQIFKPETLTPGRCNNKNQIE